MKKTLILILSLAFYSSAYGQQLAPHYGSKINGNTFSRFTADEAGNIFVYSAFDDYKGKPHGRLLKLDSNGQIVEDFAELIIDDFIRTLVIQEDGRILISGNFTTINGVAVKEMVRLNVDGSIDESFTCSPNHVGTFNLQSDGKIIVHVSNSAVRLNTDGTLDSTFVCDQYIPDFSESVIAPDDAIYYVDYGEVIKLTKDGALDTSFITGAGVNQYHISALTVQEDGKVVIGGFFTSYNGFTSRSIVRIHPNGEVDEDFIIGAGPDGQVFAITQRSNGNLLAGGQFTAYAGEGASLVELAPDGTLIKRIASVSINTITTIAETADNKIIIGGEFTTVKGVKRLNFARFNTNYSLDETFKPEVSYNNPNSIMLSARDDGTVVLTGGHSFNGLYAGDHAIEGVAFTLNPLGAFENKIPAVDKNANIFEQFIQDDGKMIFSGGLTELSWDWELIRFLPDGSVDESFEIGSGPTFLGSAAIVREIKQQGNELYLAGTIDGYNGSPSHGLVRINLDGSINQTFDLPEGSTVNDLEFQSTGKIVLVGHFPFETGTKNFIRIDHAGNIDEAFVSIEGSGYDIAVDSADRIYVIGSNPADGISYALFRLTPDGATDFSFNADKFEQPFPNLHEVLVLPDGKIAIGGFFDQYEGHDSPGFVLIDEHANYIPLSFSFGLSSAAISIDYANGALYLGGRFVSSDYTNVKAVAKILLQPVALPSSPSNLEITLKSAGTFELSWTDQSSNELGFILERGLNDSTFVALDTLDSNATTYVDAGRTRTVTYYYRVKAVNDAGFSAYSNISALAWNPAPEGQITLSISSSDENEFEFIWSGAVLYNDGYIIERSENDQSNFVAIDTVEATIHTITDIVPNDSDYYYRVAAFNSGGKLNSNTVTTIVTSVEVNAGRLILYPIPATDVLYAKQATKARDIQWSLISSTGKEIVLQNVGSDDRAVFDLHGISNGIYLVKCQANGKTITKRIVKK